VADTEFGSPAPEDVEASETAAAIAAGIPLDDEDTDYMEEAYEATQREVEQDIHGSSEEAEESSEVPEDETLLAGKYKTVKDLESGYQNLVSKIGELGPQASESQELRERLARLEGRAEVQGGTQQPSLTQRQQTRQAFAMQRARIYLDQGFDDATARDIAEKDAITMGMLVESEVNNRTAKYEQTYQDTSRDSQLQGYAYTLRDEKDQEGNALRPEWDDVVATEEFEAQARNMGSNFYTKEGLELTYLRTLPAVQSGMREASSVAAEQAKANASVSKRRASVGPAATPASKTPSRRTSDDAEIEAIYESARAGKKAKNVFDGGVFD
jgi:hypothetical protein